MAKIKTSFTLNQSLQALENNVLAELEIPQTLLHKRAFKDFLQGDQLLSERLMIKDKKDPLYVERDAVEQIYIDADMKQQYEQLAKEKGCTVSDLLFQALLNYCCQQIAALDIQI